MSDTSLDISTDPGDGIYPRIPGQRYHRILRASAHGLTTFAKSPRHFWYEFNHPSEQTPAMAFGEALHVAVLESAEFASRYVCGIDCDKRTTKGKKDWEAFQELVGGRTILKADDCEVISRMRDSIQSHPAAALLLSDATERETSIFWTDTGSGCRCRGRIDAIAASVGAILDVKTCEDASPEAFERAIYAYKYYVQAAMYIDAGMAVGRPVDSFIIIAVEKTPPYAVACYQLKSDAIEAGRNEYRALLPRFAECMRTGVWPGYSDDVNFVGLPTWKQRQIDNEIKFG